MPAAITSTFRPTPAHETALREYIRSGGSVSEAAEASGLGVSVILRVRKTRWWQDGLRAADFAPVTAEQYGDMIRDEVGRLAADIVVERGAGLDVDDLLKLGRLADGLKGVASGGGVNRVQFLAQIDFRGLTPEALTQIRGDYKPDALSDVIDVEAEVLDD